MSLNKRLSFGLAFSLMLFLALQWGVISFVFSHLSEKQLISRLSQDSEALLAGVTFSDEGKLLLNSQRISTVYQRPFSGHYYAVNAANQHQYSRSLWDSNLDTTTQSVGAISTIRLQGPEAQPLLVVISGYRKHQQDITIAVAEDISVLNKDLQYFQWVYGAISFVILMILLLIQRHIVIKSLEPLSIIRANMLRLEAGEIDCIESLGPTEIAPVIFELNRLLKVMSNQTKRSREALGNLAHALKTQITILNQLVNQTQASNSKEISIAINESTEIMRHIVDRELKRARLIANTLPGRRVEVREELALMVKTLQLMHVDKLPVIHCSIANDIHYMGNHEDFAELLGNLLDNACKWCVHDVYVTVKAQHGIIFIVEDDGPCCDLDKLDKLTQRGFRLDESKPGSGLGLAIVHDIVESYAGSLTFGQSKKYGGLQVTVWLPALETK